MMRDYPGLLPWLTDRLGSYIGHGPEYEFQCPFCLERRGSESTKRKLRVNAVKGAAYCHRCGYAARTVKQLLLDITDGRADAATQEVFEGAPVTAVSDLRDRIASLSAPDKPVPLEPVLIPEETIPLWPYVGGEKVPFRIRPAFAYLRRRGVTDEMIVNYDIGYCAAGRYARRLVFPVYQGQEQIYFTTRDCGDSRVKSLHARSVDGFYTSKQCILNYDNLIGAPHIFLVEGPFDMMAFDHAGALFGKTASSAQIALLEVLVNAGLEELTVSLDADALADAYKLARAIVGIVPKVTVIELDEGDPWSRRADLQSFVAQRYRPSLSRQLRSHLRFRLTEIN